MKEWLRKKGETLLRRIGIGEGQKVLDFGCGSGNYAIPAAKIVGVEGKVYALDKKPIGIWPGEGLSDLSKRAEQWGLTNIIEMKTSGELEIKMETESIDFVLLYDVLHNYYFPDAERRKKALWELHRVLRSTGTLSFYPGDPEISGDRNQLKTLRQEIEQTGFCPEKEYRCRLIHENSYTTGTIRNYGKRM